MWNEALNEELWSDVSDEEGLNEGTDLSDEEEEGSDLSDEEGLKEGSDFSDEEAFEKEEMEKAREDLAPSLGKIERTFEDVSMSL